MGENELRAIQRGKASRVRYVAVVRGRKERGVRRVFSALLSRLCKRNRKCMFPKELR